MTIEVISPQTAVPCLSLAAEVFASGSTLHKAAGIDSDSYRALLRDSFLYNIDQGLSVMARDDKGEVLGCVVACDLLDQGPSAPDPRLAPMQAMLHTLEQEYVELQHPKPGDALLIDMAFVRPDQAGTGVYKDLRHAAHDLARTKGFSCVIGLLSSAATQHVVANRLGHRVLARMAFTDFRFEGGAPFASITDPSEIWLTEGRLKA